MKHGLNVLSRIVLGKLYKLLGRWNTTLQPQTNYSIKPGYHHAAHAESFDDTVNPNDEWQRSVYELAVSLAQQHNAKTILDVGCGAGYKLVHMLKDYHTTGIEVEPTYSWLQKQYPSHHWLLFNNTDPAKLTADIVICSDVIEHIPNPDMLMNFLKAIHFKHLIISTPERDLVRGKNDYGPPENTAHYREWNAAEFKAYVSNWFTVQDQQVLHDKSIAQVVVCSGL